MALIFKVYATIFEILHQLKYLLFLLLFSYIKSCARKTEHIKFSWEVDGGNLVKLKPRIKLFYKGELKENISRNI